MRLISRLAPVALMTFGSAALAAPDDVRVVKVGIPDGRIQKIRDKEGATPRIVVVQRGTDPQTAMIRRMMARMEQQRITMARQAAALASVAPDKPVSPSALPSSSYSYYFMSNGTGKGSCTRIVQITSTRPGQEPKVVSHTSGDCGNTAKPATKPAPRLRVRETT